MQPIQKRVPLEINFRADWTHESHPTAWELIIPPILLIQIITYLLLALIQDIEHNVLYYKKL